MPPQPLSGQNITPGEFQTAYPTPNKADEQLITYLESNVDDYLSLLYGTPPPENTNSDMLLVKQTPVDWPLVQRMYAKDRTLEGTYNYSIAYTEESASHPVYIRDYIVRRANYSRLANGSALSGLINATVTNGGSGYDQSTVTVTLAGGTGSGGAITAIVSNGAVVQLVITAEGNYTAAPNITINNGTGATGTVSIQGSTVLLVKEDFIRTPDSPLDSLYVLVRRIYETLPGPILTEDMPFDWETYVQPMKFRQRVAFSTIASVLPAIGATYSTSSIIAHNSIASLTITDPGSGYISLPTGTIEASPGGGTQATMTVDSLKVVSATIGNPGSGYAINDVLTVAGGTFTSAATLTVSGMTLATLALNAAGTGYNYQDVVTLFGGVPSSGQATITVDTTKLVSVSVNAAGSGYTNGMTMTLTGGTFTTAATVTSATLKLVSAAINAAGSGYTNGMVITASGGTASQAAAFTVSTLKLVSVTFTNRGTGYEGGETLTAVGGTFATAAQIQVSSIRLASSAIGAGGGGYNISDEITMTGGTFTQAVTVTVLTVDGGGAVTDYAINNSGTYTVSAATLTQGSTTGGGAGFELNTCVFEISVAGITVAGDYSVTPASLTFTGGSGSNAAVTPSFGVLTFTISTAGVYTVTATTLSQSGASSPAGGTGATFQTCLYGLLTVTVASGGAYTVNSTTFTQNGASSPAGGTGATFNSGVFGIGTFSILSGGGYSTTTTTFTQDSVNPPGGTGATFQTATYTASALTVSSGGAYTVIASSPNTVTDVGAGSGMTVILDYGVGAVTLTNGGTLYYYDSPLVTLSAGNAQVVSVSDAASTITGRTGYVVDRGSTPISSYLSEIWWVIAPTPPTQRIYYQDWRNIPPLLFSITNTIYCDGTSLGSIVTSSVKKGGDAKMRKHRRTISYSLTMPAMQEINAWETQDVVYEGRMINFNHQGVLNDAISYNQQLTITSGATTCTWTEAYSFPATQPSASGFAGHWYLVGVDPKPWRGKFWRIVTLEFLA